jgi:hypothetical protein
MKTTLLLLSLLSFTLSAQSTSLTITGPASITAGGNGTLTLTLSNSTGQNLSGVQWSSATPSGISYGVPVLGSVSNTTGKGIFCNAANSTCILIGFSNATPPVISNTPFADGILATLPISIANTVAPGSLSLPLSGLFGASASGSNVAITSGATYTITVLSRCDVNGDGAVNGADIQAMIQALTGKGSCPTSSCTVQTTIQVIIAALGGACQL